MTAGTRVDGTYALINPQISASRTGKMFLKCMLRDASGRVSGRKWSVDEHSIGDVLSADFAWVSGSCENFNDQIQVKIEEIRPADVDNEELRNLLPTSERAPGEMLAELTAILNTLQHPAAKCVADHYLADASFVDRFSQVPAAKSLHHAYLGGLLDHTLQLVRMADAMLPNYPELDRDIVLLGLFLHDSGKILEFDTKSLDYTRRGNLLGHLLDGVLMLEIHCAQIRASGGIPLPAEAKLALQHIIASHHGAQEFGAIKSPSTPEAIFVSQLDDLDAKSRMAIDAAARETADGSEFSEQIHALRGVRMCRIKPLEQG
jgi:3'-5' exoribonuclease